jgi:maltose alpha-D-glucosyltransferase/alpha-amylase
MANEFLTAYLTEAQGGAFLPADEEEYDLLLDCMLIEKALYELRYELDHRPDWVTIPLRGLVELLEERQ